MGFKKQLRYVALSVAAFAGITKDTKVKIEYPEGAAPEPLKGIDKDNGLVIVFPNGYNYVQFEGDQEVGKTSIIECIKEAAGGIASSDTVHQGVDEEGKPKADKKYLEKFYGTDGGLYELRVTKTTIALEQIELDEDGNPVLDKKGKEIRSIRKEPKTLLQKIVGAAGISPMTLKEMNGGQQVKWLRSLYNLDLEVETFEEKLKQDFNTTYQSRTSANREYDRYAKILSDNEYYKKYEEWQKYFEAVTFEDLKASVDGVIRKKNTYDQALIRVEAIKDSIEKINIDIEDFEEQIKSIMSKIAVKQQAKEVELEKLKIGLQFIEANKEAPNEFIAITDKIKETDNYGAHRVNFDNMVNMKKTMDHNADEKIRLTSRLDELAKTKKDYVKKFSPVIPGFEVLIADEEDKREGLFYKNKSLAILAESELWELATQLWKELNVKIIYVENVSSLGSGAIQKFNEFLSQGGCYIFGTKMNRAEDNLKISFHTNIPG